MLHYELDLKTPMDIGSEIPETTHINILWKLPMLMVNAFIVPVDVVKFV